MKNALLIIAALAFFAPKAHSNLPLTVSEDLKLTSDQYEKFFRLFPRVDREAMLQNPEILKDRVLDMHSDAVIEKLAAAAGVDDNPLIAAKLARARQQILVLSYMEGLGNERPDEETWEALAKEKYILNKKKLVTDPERYVAHILVAESTNCACQTQTPAERAADLVQRIQGGEDFGALAQEYSADPGSAENGGVLPNPVKQDGMTVPAFEQAAFALQKVGEISAPVKTQFGYHIIKLLDIKRSEQLTYNQVREQLRHQVLLDIKTSAQTKVRARAYPIIDDIDFEGLRSVLRKLNQ